MKKPQILLAFDFGMKRIGAAIGQTVTETATPLNVIHAKDGLPDWTAVNKLTKKWLPDAIIVGIPLNMDGTSQPLTTKAQQFAHLLREKFQITVYEIDERLTTKAARETLFAEGGYKALQGGQVDCAAAQLILQNWFAQKSNK